MAERVCPWWLGYWLVSPLRKFLNDPDKMFKPYIREGMNVLDIGSGMGYFSLPLARMTGETGKVVCVDLQEKMLSGLSRRALKAGLLGRIQPRQCTASSLNIHDLDGTFDFVLLFAVAHEVPDKDRLLTEIYAAMKKGAKLYFSEPKGHVSDKDFEDFLGLASTKGFKVESIGLLKVLLVKQ